MTLEICTHRWERESEHVRRCAWCGLEDDQTPPARVEVERLRARLSEAEDRCDEHVAHVVEIGDVLWMGRRPQRQPSASCANWRLVEALADALEWANKCLVVGYKPTGDIRKQIDDALRAAGRKT